MLLYIGFEGAAAAAAADDTYVKARRASASEASVSCFHSFLYLELAANSDRWMLLLQRCCCHHHRRSHSRSHQKGFIDPPFMTYNNSIESYCNSCSGGRLVRRYYHRVSTPLLLYLAVGTNRKTKLL